MRNVKILYQKALKMYPISTQAVQSGSIIQFILIYTLQYICIHIVKYVNIVIQY